MRDNFDRKTIEILSKRVGNRCSNPNCRQPTSGPKADPGGAINIGVAAHITAASNGGPRYSHTLSTEERSSIENGIWLCQSCSKLIDSDVRRYNTDILSEWKSLSEQAALLNIEGHKNYSIGDDVELIKFYAQCFDRRVFQDSFKQEDSLNDFDEAIKDTIVAICTGHLRSRNGDLLGVGKGKAYIHNQRWQEQLSIIVDLLKTIRERYAFSIRNGDIHITKTYYCINDVNLSTWFDSTRIQVLTIFQSICQEAGIRWDNNFDRKKQYW